MDATHASDVAEQLVAREQRARMPIRSATKQDQVEDRQLNRIALREVAHEQLLILVRHLLDVIEVRDIDRVDGGGRELGADLGEELGFEERVVGVCEARGTARPSAKKISHFEKSRVSSGAMEGGRRAAARVLGSEPPETATLKVPCLLMPEFWAWTT
ncbi:hypothetical protein VE04_09944 [Pseudogymnoascus sp. 24MN13]|nr:hypothetical protein VE04_09944 [Pseudogymnoascus sp. 24MN13]